MIHNTYVLTLHGPEVADDAPRSHVPGSSLREVEENLTDLLPTGFWVVIESFDDLLSKEEVHG